MVTRAQLAEFEAAAEPPNTIVTVMACDIVRAAPRANGSGEHIIQELISKGYTVAEVQEHGLAAANEAARIALAHGDLEEDA
jgi:hypothetical protein